ncbi:MAG: outer membrane protein transport protein [Rhodomicrobiaceae bacterium]
MTMRVLKRSGLRFGVSIVALLIAGVAATTTAHAGAFAVREQSAYYQGMSFAGSAAGDDLSSMFWNSAAAAAAPGINSETSISLVVPHTEITSTGTSALDGLFGLDTHSGDIGRPTPVPASYANYQLTDKLFFGLATNSQYGFTTKPDNLDFAGTPIATTSRIFSINFNPNLAYKFTPELTVGVGVQIMYADLRLRSSNSDAITNFATGGLVTSDGRTTQVDDWGFGATAGVIWKPAPGTSIGVGYRSAIDLKGKGTCTGLGLSNLATGTLPDPNPFGCLVPGGANVTADLTLPDMVTGSFRHNLTDRLALLGTVEWTNWSRVGAQAEFKNSAGQIVDVFPLDYNDGWFFSAGLEYAWSPDTTFRTGLGYELSPISDKTRTVALPDNDRLWLSIGASHKLWENASIDLGYTHLFVKDAPITAESSLGTLLEAESTGDIDIVSAAFKYNWGGPERELEPLK